MNTNVNLEAALGVLAFLGSCGLLFLISLVGAHALLMRKWSRLRATLLLGFGFLMLYVGLLLIFSFSSREKQLARGEEKHFCEIDCHLAYAVTDISKAKTLGAGAAQATAKGVFYLVTVRTRFDEKTISSRRGYSPLTPNSRAVHVFDAAGASYEPSPEGTKAYLSTERASTPIETPLRPGESYTTTFVFDLPEKIASPTLLINEGDFITHLVIGHENSPLHKKVVFLLDESPAPQASNNSMDRLLYLAGRARNHLGHVGALLFALMRKIEGD